MNRPARLATLVTTAGLAAGAVAAPAHAASYAVTDPAGDVVTLSGNGSAADAEPAPAETSVDATDLAVHYGTRKLTISLQTVDLERKGQIVAGLFVVRTPERRFTVNVTSFRYRDRWQPTDTSVYTPKGRSPRCPRLHGDLDFVNDVISVTVPTTCLEDAPSVRVGAASLRGRGDTTWADDAQRAGGIRERGTMLSPAIAQGRV